MLSTEDIRRRSVDFLREALQTAVGAQAPPELIAQRAASLESALYSLHRPSDPSSPPSNDYRSSVRNHGLTLKKDNPELALAFVRGAISPHALASMSAEQMETPEQALREARLKQKLLDRATGVDDFMRGIDPAFAPTSEIDYPLTGLGANASGGPGDRLAPEAEVFGEDCEFERESEGEFKARRQVKCGESLRAIEFDTCLPSL